MIAGGDKLPGVKGKSVKVPDPLCNSVINKTPIDANTNCIVGGNAPPICLRRLQRYINSADLHRVLESDWLNPDLLVVDRFAECFVERGECPATIKLASALPHWNLLPGFRPC